MSVAFFLRSGLLCFVVFFAGVLVCYTFSLFLLVFSFLEVLWFVSVLGFVGRLGFYWFSCAGGFRFVLALLVFVGVFVFYMFP